MGRCRFRGNDRGFLIKLTYFVFFLLALTFLATIPALASVFTYYPGEVSSDPVPPPLVLKDPGDPQVSVSLGVNSTSAEVSVKATSGLVELTYNGEFSEGPDGWLFAPGTYLSNAVWRSPGIITIYGYVGGGFVSDDASILQEVWVPEAPVSHLEVSVVYRVRSVSTTSLHWFFVGLYDPDVSTFVWSDAVPVGSFDTWLSYYSTIPAGSVVGGENYYVVAGYFIWHFFGAGTYAIDFDSVRLYANVTQPTYTGEVLLADVVDSSTYTAKLTLESLSVAGGSFNATIWLVNTTGHATSEIVIEEGVPVVTETSYVRIQQPPSGYSSLFVYVDTSIDPTVVASLNLILSYNLSGVTVSYPVEVEVVDPEPPPGVGNETRGSEGGALGVPEGLDLIKRLISDYIAEALRELKLEHIEVAGNAALRSSEGLEGR